jgi:hypothetical protein
MIRTLNVACVALAALSCLGLYRVAEGARVARAELSATTRAVAHERGVMTVLGAEWARLTQPNRIQALAARHLDLSDRPLMELSSLSALPRRERLVEDPIRTAKAEIPFPDASAASPVPLPLAAPGVKLVAMQTGM